MALITKARLAERASRLRLYESRILAKAAGTILREDAAGVAVSQTFDVFLSHSYLDAKEILALATIIREMHFSVFVDWEEAALQDRSKVSKETAALLRKRMQQCQSLFFATSENAAESRWMPWELGYFDGIKGRVAVLPVLARDTRTDRYVGREYLGLYPYVTSDPPMGESRETLWIHDSESRYVAFSHWLEGKQPTERQR